MTPPHTQKEPPSQAAVAERDKLREQMIAWRSLAQEMTPGGSEFMSPESVRAYYRQQKDETHQAKKDLQKLREQVKVLLVALKAVVDDLTHGTTGRWKGEGSASLRAAIAKAEGNQ